MTALIIDRNEGNEGCVRVDRRETVDLQAAENVGRERVAARLRFQSYIKRIQNPAPSNPQYLPGLEQSIDQATDAMWRKHDEEMGK